MEEMGVIVAYMAFGFICWKESENFEREYKAPILLVHIIFTNNSSIEAWHINMTEDEFIKLYFYKIVICLC